MRLLKQIIISPTNSMKNKEVFQVWIWKDSWDIVTWKKQGIFQQVLYAVTLWVKKKRVGGTTFTFACTCKTKLWKDSQTAVANFRRRSNWADGRKAFHNVPVWPIQKMKKLPGFQKKGTNSNFPLSHSQSFQIISKMWKKVVVKQT